MWSSIYNALPFVGEKQGKEHICVCVYLEEQAQSWQQSLYLEGKSGNWEGQNYEKDLFFTVYSCLLNFSHVHLELLKNFYKFFF